MQLITGLKFWRNSMNSVIHFEMPYEDQERMRKFYE